jgi:acetoin utilization protein AcuC
MSESVAVVWNDLLRKYDFGPNHPLSPIRVQLAMRLIEDFGLLDHPNVTIIDETPILSDAVLERVHTKDLIAAVKRASVDDTYDDAEHGLGTADTPVFPGMHDAAARICGASLVAAEAILTGQVEHAVNLSGGLHHSMPDRAAGFCVYNDASVAIQWLLDQGVEKIAYIDVDVHHGDGVQMAFWDEPRVMTMSIHESPASLFPGTGWATEIGGPRALGSAVNLPLPAGTGDQGWLRGLHAVFPPLLGAFKPDFIVSQHGCDGHFEDPLASMALSIDGLRMAAEGIHRWAHKHADGNWLALGGGGYEWVDVVPRAWTNVAAEAIGHPIAPATELPVTFRDYVSERMGRLPPFRMTDGYEPWPKPWDMGYDPSDPVDAAINATRSSVFPFAGLVVDSLGGF